MRERYRVRLDALRGSVITGPGETEPALRASVAAWAGAQGPRDGLDPAVPIALTGYVDKVAVNAYEVVDHDFGAASQGRLLRGPGLRDHGERFLRCLDRAR